MGLGPINEDVRFDHDAATRLISLCNSAAATIEGQIGSRSGWVSTAGRDFQGYFSELFARNQETARNDATEIAFRLREVSGFVTSLADDAREEQARRVEAREWQRERDERNALEKGWDWLTNDNDIPVPDMPEPEDFSSETPPAPLRETPRPGSGGGGAGMGVSSARPADLRTFAQGARGANSALSGKPTTCQSAYSDFVAGCGWGSLSAQSVFTGFRRYLDANEEDVLWVDAVADAFEQAGSAGGVSTLSNSALTAALQARNIDASRQDIVVDPAIAVGAPPTSGYADDPVNAATGNFIEPETDLGLIGGCGSLVLRRMYNSFDAGVGAFGPGWSSWTETGLEISDESARMRLEDGRVVVFPRQGDGWDRATGENRWLVRDGQHLVATTNDGERRVHAADGRLVEVSRGTGTGFRLSHDDAGRLVRLDHVRGRSIELTWSGEATDEGTGGRVVEARTSDGRTATYAYDEAGQLVGVTTASGTRTYHWNGEGLICAVVDPDGVVEVENTYDDRARVTAQRSAHGRVSRYVYLDGNVTVVSDRDGTRSNTWISDARGRLIGAVDSHEQRQSFAYDAHGNRVMVTERDGAVTVREHDDRGRLVREVTPSGADLTYGYDEHDRVTTVVTESGAVTEYAYADDTGEQRNPSVLTDPEGGRTTFTWSDGLLTGVVDPVGVTVTMDYDDHGDLIATTNAAGDVARLERDAHGRVVAAITPLGHRTSFVYAPSGPLSSRRDPDGAVWHYEHTAAGRLSAIVDPTGARTEVEHNDAGDATRTIDPLGRSITRTFDDLGNLTSAELPDGTTWRFAHDAMSRLTATTTPDGSVWGREYDTTGDLVATVDPLGARETYSQDPASNTLTIEDASTSVSTSTDSLGRMVAGTTVDGSSVMATYDRCGRVVEQLDADGGLTRIQRDAAGRPVAMTSATGITTRYDYDACGRLAAVIDDAGGRSTRSYDADGRPVRVELANGDVARHEYDVCGRVVANHLPGRGVSRYRYDPAGRVVEASDTWHGHRRFRYDDAGQLVAVTDGNGGVTRYDYDAGGRAVAVTDPLGHTTRREFDAMNRCTAETDPLGRTTRAGYDAAGRIAWQTDPDGRTTTWSYDEAGRITGRAVDGHPVSRIVHRPDQRETHLTDLSADGAESSIELEWNRRGQLVRRTADGHSVLYDYDADGRRTSVTAPSGHVTSYDYDSAGRLQAVDHPLLGRAAFTRDAAGRLVEASAGDTVQSWEYADGYLVAHTVTTMEGSTRTDVMRDEGRIVGLTRDSEHTSFDYDQARQLIAARTAGRAHQWRYDAAGRLVAETIDGLTVDHAYDEAGQLVRSTDTERTTTYAYDGAGRRTREESSDGMLRELRWGRNARLERISDTLPGGETRTTRTRVDATGMLTHVDDAAIHWDVAGTSPRLLGVGRQDVLAAGPVTGIDDRWSVPGWRTQRSTGADPWAATGGTPAFAGEMGAVAVGADGGLSVAGLEWLGARVYDPASRGFLSVDPLDPVTGSGWSGNPYSYAGNDPLHALDPHGLRPLTDADLSAYNAANNTGFAAAGDWVADNWEYLAGGAMVIAGGVLIATGVGGPAGAMLVAAGADTIIQKAQNGSVNWGQVAISGAFGAWSGVGTAARLGVTSMTGRYIVGGAISGATSGGVGGAYSYATGPGPHSVNGLLQSTAMGSATGGATGGLAGGAGRYVDVWGERMLSSRGAIPELPDPYAGVREASQMMQEQGVPREIRVQVLQSFREGTVHVETAGPNTYSVRQYGGDSGATGYYSAPDLTATRSELALPPGNTMENIAQFQIPEGTRYLAGEVGPNFGHPGGGQQYVVTNLDHMQQVGGAP